ncbi:hypothetical protein [Actinoplanes rectilineatus]|uniref:hypothetical protein n=1 Tax=Actinoplanes rectilineatus TaxID=113571 RepID=UPI0005F2D176|nr:hypothetical protein [Actinoplanes rectilineatus]
MSNNLTKLVASVASGSALALCTDAPGTSRELRRRREHHRNSVTAVVPALSRSGAGVRPESGRATHATAVTVGPTRPLSGVVRRRAR